MSRKHWKETWVLQLSTLRNIFAILINCNQRNSLIKFAKDDKSSVFSLEQKELLVQRLAHYSSYHYKLLIDDHPLSSKSLLSCKYFMWPPPWSKQLPPSVELVAHFSVDWWQTDGPSFLPMGVTANLRNTFVKDFSRSFGKIILCPVFQT